MWVRNVASVLCYRHTRYSAFFVYIGLLDRCDEEMRLEKAEHLREAREANCIQPKTEQPLGSNVAATNVVPVSNADNMPDLLNALPKTRSYTPLHHQTIVKLKQPNLAAARRIPLRETMFWLLSSNKCYPWESERNRSHLRWNVYKFGEHDG